MAEGARFIAENFKSYVETGKVTFGARMMLAMLDLMGAMAPKALRAENWPLDREKLGDAPWRNRWKTRRRR